MRFDRRPLLDNPVDVPLFVDRDDELGRLGRSAALHLNSVVVGAPGVGKTSLLRQFQWRERASSRPSLFLTNPGVDPASVLARVYAGLWQTTIAVAIDPIPGDEPVPRDVVGQDALAAAGWLAELSALRPRTLVLLDDVSVELARSLFGGLRDELWQANLTWVVAAREVDAPGLLAPPVDAFFETVLRLGGLQRGPAMELVERRWTGEEPTIGSEDLRVLVRAAGGNPRRLVDMAREVVLNDRSTADVVADFTEHDARLERVSPGARKLAGELAGRGVAGPSDEDVQQRMGLSRPRLIQLFGELEDAGLAHKIVQPADGPGRPRFMYRLAPLHAIAAFPAAVTGQQRL